MLFFYDKYLLLFLAWFFFWVYVFFVKVFVGCLFEFWVFSLLVATF